MRTSKPLSRIAGEGAERSEAGEGSGAARGHREAEPNKPKKLSKKLLVILYGSEYWNEVFDLRPLAEWGAIADTDLDLLCRVDSAEHGFEELKKHLIAHHMAPQTAQETVAPGIAKTRG